MPLERLEISQLGTSTGYDERLLTDKKTLLQAINHSLRYLNSSAAIRAYQNYPISEITRQRVQRSLVRFRQLVQKSPTPAALQKAVKKEFIWLQLKYSRNVRMVRCGGLLILVFVKDYQILFPSLLPHSVFH